MKNLNDLYNYLEISKNTYNNDPELIKIILDFMGKEGHKKIENQLFRDLITQYSKLSLELKEKLAYITELSETDPLTKAYNRMKFTNSLNEEITRAMRYKHCLSIIMLDIDFFKKVNDNYGHDIGDSVLVEASSLIKENIRKIDIFARWGGEEFIILLPETEIKGASILAEKLRHCIENHEFHSVKNITSSFGVTELIPEEDYSSFTKRVDEALYNAKKSGRNRVCQL